MSRLPSTRIVLLAWVLTSLVCLGAFTNDDRIELPTYEVTTTPILPLPESWYYARLPNLEVLSDGSANDTKRLIQDLMVLDQALDIVWPTIHGRATDQAYLVVCKDRFKFDAFMPKGMSNNLACSSYYLSGDTRSALVLSALSRLHSFATDQVTSSMKELGVASSGLRVDAEKQLSREYVHYLLSNVKPRLPAWLEEGLSQLVMAMNITPTQIEFGRLEDPNSVSPEQYLANEETKVALANIAMMGETTVRSAPSEDREFQASLSKASLMKFSDFFSVDRNSSVAKNPIGSSWAKQCYAFVHLCLFSEEGRYRNAFIKFVADTADTQPTETLFKQAFGMSYREMSIMLRSYVNFASYRPLKWKLKKGAKGLDENPTIELREATQSEIGRIKGETFLLAGNRDAAREEMVTAYRRGEQDPQLWASLGIFEANGGDSDRARRLLVAATTAKVEQPEPYIALAKIRYREAADLPGVDVSFKPEQIRGIISLLSQAARFQQSSSGLYELLAETWSHSPSPITKDDATLLLRGVLAYPDNLKLAYQTSVLCANAKLFKEANAFASRGILLSITQADKTRFEKLKSSLPNQKN